VAEVPAGVGFNLGQAHVVAEKVRRIDTCGELSLH
jgi:hypothetical protein